MADITFPTSPEVCLECRTGKHVMHVINELGDLRAEWETSWSSAGEPGRKILVLKGHAEDELFLEDLLRVLALEYGRMKAQENPTELDVNNYLLVPLSVSTECPNCNEGTIEKVGNDLYRCRGPCGAYFHGPCQHPNRNMNGGCDDCGDPSL